MKKHLKQIADVNHNSYKVQSFPIKYLDTSNISENVIDEITLYKNKTSLPSRARRAVKDKTIIFSLVRPDQKHFGLLNSPDSNLVVSTGFATIDVKDKSEYSPEYIYYTLTHPDLVLHLHRIAKNNASSYPSLTPDDLLNLEIDFPDTYETQSRIGELLASFESKIEVNRELVAKLHTYLDLIFAYWFVQYEFPNKSGAPYASSGGKFTLDSNLQRKIPSAWEVNKLSSLIDIKSGYSFKPSDYLNSGNYGIITIKNVKNRYLDIETMNYVNVIPSKLPSSCVLKKGDLLVSLTGNVGRSCLVDKDNLLLNQRVGIITGNSAEKRFAYLFFARPEFRKRMENLANGSSQDNLSPVDLISDLQVLPPSDLLVKFEELTNPIVDKILSLTSENRELKAKLIQLQTSLIRI